MNALSILKSSGRAALVALVLGASAVTAMPAQAQSDPSFSFQLGLDNGGSVLSFNSGRSRGFHPIRSCLTDRQVIRGLDHRGFDDVFLAKKLTSSRSIYGAEWRGRDYALRVNKCTGEVYDIQRTRGRDDGPGRPGPGGPGRPGDRPGFGLQFNF